MLPRQELGVTLTQSSAPPTLPGISGLFTVRAFRPSKFSAPERNGQVGWGRCSWLLLLSLLGFSSLLLLVVKSLAPPGLEQWGEVKGRSLIQLCTESITMQWSPARGQCPEADSLSQEQSLYPLRYKMLVPEDTTQRVQYEF